MELKYTNDGKKVAVIGKLNAQESIVQEIFVINEQEIPSGENFVAKSLHDSPAISWKEKEEKRIETSVNQLKKDYEKAENDHRRLMLDLRNKSSAIKDHIKYITSLLSAEIDPAVLNTLETFLSGEIKYIVWEGYQLKIQSFFDAIQQSDTYHGDSRYESLRLLSLFGKDDGTFSWKINNYRDGSGSWHDVSGYQTLDEAKERLKEVLIQKGINDASIEIAKKYNISLPAELSEEWEQKKRSNIQKQIDEYFSKMELLKQQLNINLSSEGNRS
jgi:hypothetical protein